MDVRRLRIGEWLMAVAGVALLAVLVADGDVSVTRVVLAALAVAGVAAVPVVAAARTAAPGVAYEALVLLGGLIGIVFCLAGTLWAPLVAVLALCAACLVAMRDERLSRGDRLTDSTGKPVEVAPAPEELPAPRA
ncbi:MAG TPA: hypothetical protein VEX39_14100 [Thermoleophilaceae bacterium]|nr:hypothetical protein [Thermoleophilaceae bacterium]